MTNPIGRLTSMIDGSGSTTYNHDNAGRITRSVKTVGGTSYLINYAYSLGRLSGITYPDNETVAYGYDGAGNLASAGVYAAFFGYNALGQSRIVTYGNGVGTAYQYKPSNNRLSSIITTSPVQGQLINLSYLYDNKGNIKTISGLNDSDVPNYPSSNGYTLYPGKAHAIGSTTGGRSFQYDANGNMTSDGQRTFTYTLENMPKLITTSTGNVSFIYDGNNGRVKKISRYGTTLYIDKLYECTGGVCGKYIFAGNSRVALKTSAKTLYYHGDHLGSTLAVTNAAGAVKQNFAYYPYGETRSESGTEAVNHRYTGQEYDDETGLYNYNARLYSPEFEGFISPDSIVPDYTNPQSLNRYAYALNNPLRYTDPTGHDPLITFDTDGNIKIGASGSQFIPTLNLSYGGNGNNSGYNVPNYNANSANANLTGVEGVNPANWNTEPLIGPFDFIGMGLPKLLGLGLIGGIGEGIVGALGRDVAEEAATKIGSRVVDFIGGVEVKSFGKIIGEGTVHVRPTIDAIENGILKSSGIYKNFEMHPQLLENSFGYWNKYELLDFGRQSPLRLLKGNGGEYFLSPDHYKSLIPLHY
jgi:RHS repeat-associated protein